MSMPDVVAADAPGRVNLIGEHTDYHQGYVLPTTIPIRTRVELRGRSDTRIHAVSTAYSGSSVEYRLGHEAADGSWGDYVKGTTFALARRGVELAGFDVHIASDIPAGAGLSSSAALLVALLRGLRALFSLPLGDLDIALVAQAAETEFVGAPVGIMDQMVCSLGQVGAALFIDTRTLGVEVVALPIGLELAVIDSGVTHRHAGGGYVERRGESFAAATALKVSHLRDVGADDERLALLPPPLRNRARHVIGENARVLEAVTALRSNNPATLGRLLNASHASLRDDYDVSTADVDALVELAQRHPAVYGARMTGGGFGGAVIVAMRPGNTDAAQGIAAEYGRLTGRPGVVRTILSA